MTVDLLQQLRALCQALLLGGAMETAIADVSVKAVTSLTNGTLAVVVATLLAPVLRTALERAGVGGKMARR